MMINKRLIQMVPGAEKYIALDVFMQWLGLTADIVFVFCIARCLNDIENALVKVMSIILYGALILLSLVVKYVTAKLTFRFSLKAAAPVKIILRDAIFKKLFALGRSYSDHVLTAKIVQLTVEGVDQLEVYFGSYLPQFFYCMVAPVTLFAVFSFISLRTAIVLFICVPLIPVSIVVVQKIAKKLLSRYWAEYATLADNFLEDLNGLTTLKVYQSDEYMHRKLNQESEKFRKMTMKVLTMQLNSIIVMDFFAYGGTALGILFALTDFYTGAIGMAAAIEIILLSADFFIPMRKLGSFFHVAMNGMAAVDSIFALLDINECVCRDELFANGDIVLKNVTFGYSKERSVLQSTSVVFPEHQFSAVVGVSGSGKSTIAGILTGRNRKYVGSVTVGGVELSCLSEKSLMEHVTLISTASYIFSGTVRETLLAGKPGATDEELMHVLDEVHLSDFFAAQDGLDTMLSEHGDSISGGQRQRLALARGMLHDTPVYIFDEATSNIDVASENDILKLIVKIARTKTVILITHRLANCVAADRVNVLSAGEFIECGTHRKLLSSNTLYKKMWMNQQTLESFGGARCNEIE